MIDEATGISDDIWKALDRNKKSRKMISIGAPLSKNRRFKDIPLPEKVKPNGK